MARRLLTKRNIFIGLLLLLCIAAASPASASRLNRWLGCAPPQMDEVCDSFEENLKDFTSTKSGKCWSCDIFLLFFDAANEVAGHVNNVIAGPATYAMVVFLGIWLVFNTAVFFSSVSDAPNLGEFATKVGGMMLRGGFAAVFLAAGSSFAFNYFINPVLIAGSSLGTTILQSSNEAIQCAPPSGGGGTAKLPMGTDVKASLECFINAISSGLARSQAIAQGMRCGSAFWAHIDIWVVPCAEIYLPNPLMWLFGAVLGCLFWMIAFLFPITMLDVIFRIGLMVGMLPLFLVAWVFPATRNVAKAGWDIFFHSTMVFSIAALLVAMIVNMVESAWGVGSPEKIEEFKSLMSSNAYVDAWDKLFNEGGLTAIIIILMVSFWGLVLAPKTDELASAFVSGDPDEFPESCGIRALHATIQFIIDVIMFILTIITMGIGACLYCIKIAQYFAKAAKAAKRVQKLAAKAKKMQKRLQKMRKIQQKAKKIRSIAKGNVGGAFKGALRSKSALAGQDLAGAP